MKHFQLFIRTLPLVIIFGALVTGCATTTRDISTDEAIHYDEAYDFSDKKKIVESLTAPLLASPALQKQADRPTIIIYPIANRTSEHIDTSGISDDIRLRLLNSGRFRFLNEAQRENIARETAYQYGGAVDPATRIRRARQQGADYILSGTLRSIEKKEGKGIRLTKKKLNYYSLNMELTHLETGLIDWAYSVELARESSTPIIGW